MGLTTFTFDSPISINTNAYDKSHRHSHTPALPIVQPKKHSPIFSSIANHIFHPFKRNSVSGESTSSVPVVEITLPPSFAKESLFFRLLRDVRGKIYSYVYGSNETYHILLQRNQDNFHRPQLRETAKYTIGHRRCRANGPLEQCVLAKCKPMFDLHNGIYLGPFEDILGLLLTAKTFYTEALPHLYKDNTFEFDHAGAYLLFAAHPKSIDKLTITVPTMLYNYTSAHLACPTFKPEQWTMMWNFIAESKVEEVKVVFKLPVEGWVGWSMGQVLELLGRVAAGKMGRGLRVFEIEMPVGKDGNWEVIDCEARGKALN